MMAGRAVTEVVKPEQSWTMWQGVVATRFERFRLDIWEDWTGWVLQPQDMRDLHLWRVARPQMPCAGTSASPALGRMWDLLRPYLCDVPHANLADPTLPLADLSAPGRSAGGPHNVGRSHTKQWGSIYELGHPSPLLLPGLTPLSPSLGSSLKGR